MPMSKPNRSQLEGGLQLTTQRFIEAYEAMKEALDNVQNEVESTGYTWNGAGVDDWAAEILGVPTDPIATGKDPENEMWRKTVYGDWRGAVEAIDAVYVLEKPNLLGVT